MTLEFTLLLYMFISVFLEVAKLIGRDVRSLARALIENNGLSEIEIQNLMSQNNDLQETTLQVI